MCDTHASSVLWSVRTKGSMSFSFNEYTSLLTRKFDACQVASSSSVRYCACSCCCSCKYLTANRVILNPGILYGLRQSSLIQWSPYGRRLVLRAGGRFIGRFPVCDVDGDLFAHSRSVSESFFGGSTAERKKRKSFRCLASEELYEELGVEDSEAMLSLLTEECICEGVRNKVERGKRKYGSEGFGGQKSGQVNKTQHYRHRFDGENKGSCSSLLSDSKHGYKSVAKSNETRNRESEDHLAGEAQRRKSISSCSSYHSFSSGQLQSDVDNWEETVNSKIRSKTKCDKSSRYNQQYDGGEEKSVLAMELDQHGRKKLSPRKRHEVADIHEIHVDDRVDMSSIAQERVSGKEGHATFRDHVLDRGSNNIRMHEKPSIEIGGSERTSQMQSHSGLQKTIHEEDLDLMQSSIKRMRNQQQQSQQYMIEQSGLRRRADRSSKPSSRAVDNRTSFTSGNRRNQDESSSFVSNSQQLEEQSELIQNQDQRTTSELGSADLTSVTVSHSTDIVRASDSQRNSINRIVEQEKIPKVKSQGEMRETNGLVPTESGVMQMTFPAESQHSYGLYESPSRNYAEASVSISSLGLSSRNRFQPMSLDEKMNSKTTLLPPPSQLVRRGLEVSDLVDVVNIRGASDETSGSGFEAAFTQPDMAMPGPSNQSFGNNYGISSPGLTQNFTSHVNVLGSAQRSDQVSTQMIGEFVEKARHDILISEAVTQKRTSDVLLPLECESTAQSGLNETQLNQQESRQSSGLGGEKGPSDEMWVTDHPSLHQTPEPDAAGSSSATQDAVVKRPGRSLWSFIGDVFRLRWASRGGAFSTAAKSGRKSSPGESVSSEAWFSGREHESASSDENRVDSEEVASSRRHQVSQTSFQGGVSVSIRQKEKLLEHETELPSSSKIEGGEKSLEHETELPSSSKIEGGSSSSSGLQSSMAGYGNIGIDGGPVSGAVLGEPSLQLPAHRLERSPIVRETSESGSIGITGDVNLIEPAERPEAELVPKTTGSVPKDGALRQRKVHSLNEDRSIIDDPGLRKKAVETSTQLQASSPGRSPVATKISDPTPSHAINSGASMGHLQIGRDGFLKQNKLDRTNQVLRDRFDEWEEAYRREAEQRRTDEMFMREALKEAKKAADFWEVPVGAVLVHEGKIIARGYNLVEELRDSTAHAEMICIREASSVLRSWRLADTTLYVTLEPCPMCAGAILQARINTLVWGAPNKLLGADGSWIKLFPESGGNGGAPSDKPPAPVHPFHPKMTIRRGILASDCADAMQQFFQLRRKKKTKDIEPLTTPTETRVSHHPSKVLAKLQDIFHIMFCL